MEVKRRQPIVPYRDAALDRLSSPEQLDQLLETTHPRGWVTLLGLLAPLVAAAVWATLGTVSTEVTGRGVVLSREDAERGVTESAPGGEALGVVVFLPAPEAQAVRRGMEVQCTPLASPRSVAPLAGRVRRVGELPAATVALDRVFEGSSPIPLLTGEDQPVPVEIALVPERGTGAGDGSSWLTRGARVQARILLRREHPYELVLPAAWSSEEPQR